MRVLSGDIGGTNCRLAMARVEGGQVELERVIRYRNEDYPGLEAILSEFLGSDPIPKACCLAVAGPTDGRRVAFTNMDWRVDAEALAHRFGFTRASLVNDFAAVGWGLGCLGREQLAALQEASATSGAPRVALGAGTGLGVSLCAWRNGHYEPLPSEGGHMSFAPVGAEQDRLLAFLRGIHGRVSVARILSGPGIVDLYRFCLEEAGHGDSPLLAATEPAPAISAAGLQGGDAQAASALRLFAAILGQTAGDLALVTRAGGGVYLAGGIAPQLLATLRNGAFLAGFRAKGRFSAWMESVPVSVVLDSDVGLKGAAVAAGHSL